jgi:hypothetical protein
MRFRRWVNWPRVTGYHASAVPKFEAVELILALGKQTISLVGRLFVGKVGKLLERGDMPVSYEIAAHEWNSSFWREFASYLARGKARWLSVIE